MRLPEEMAKHWFALPLVLRRRWWEETEYGKHEPSDELKAAVQDVIDRKAGHEKQ